MVEPSSRGVTNHDAKTQAQGRCEEGIALLYLEIPLTGDLAYELIDAYDAGSNYTSCEKVRTRQDLARVTPSHSPTPLVTHMTQPRVSLSIWASIVTVSEVVLVEGLSRLRLVG